MSQDQNDKREQDKLNSQKDSQPGAETPRNEGNLNKQTPVASKITADANDTKDSSVDSARVDNRENKDYNHAPAMHLNKDGQPYSEATEAGDRNENKEKDDDEILEYKDVKHPHERKTPEADSIREDM